MVDQTRFTAGRVHEAADQAWGEWSAKLAAIKPKQRTAKGAKAAGPKGTVKDTGDNNEKFIAKIKKRMKEYPDFYELDQDKVAGLVTTELVRIGTVLVREFPKAEAPVKVWDVPISVCNWLADNKKGFVHGALKAISNVDKFNEANKSGLDDEERAELRAPLFEIVPPLVQGVLVKLLKDPSLRLRLGKKYVGPDFKYLVLEVEQV